MNSLETLVREYANVYIESPITAVLTCVVFTALIMAIIMSFVTPVFESGKEAVFGFMLIFILISGGLYFIFFGKTGKSIDLKREYNISLEEKQNKIELAYNKKADSYANIKDKFKVVFTKDNEENYYVYFDEKADEKKATSFKEIKQFVKSNVDYEYYEALENFKLKDLEKNKNKQKEETIKNETDKTTIDELQKKLDELKKKESTKKEVSDEQKTIEQLQKELDELKKERKNKNE